MKPLYIFDLDGTLALCNHRQHYLDDVEDSYRWRKFYAACDRDEPNAPVIATMERLVATFDDRTRVVEMWRGCGVTCFQVAPGEF